MPRGLFLKIFIWFGSTMLTMIAITFLVVGFIRPHRHDFLSAPLMHLGAMMLIGAAFCYWLARHLTAPVAKLRKATNDLANGNLEARVGPSIGKRRDELAALGRDFDLMAERMESLLNAQRRLLGDISHELRSPLTRLNVALELARQRAGPEAASALQRIHQEAETLNEMIGQLLALTRLETGTRAINTSHFNLTTLVADIVNDADFEARSRNRSVHLTSCDSLMITGSKELLHSAIENVVRNAVHYTTENSVVEIALKTNGPASDGENNSSSQILHVNKYFAELTVRDHGVGVPENALVEIFRPFYRVDDARDRESGGTGLGLAITERAIRLHGGSVAATNAPNGGLIVTIKLPCENGCE